MTPLVTRHLPRVPSNAVMCRRARLSQRKCLGSALLLLAFCDEQCFASAALRLTRKRARGGRGRDAPGGRT